MNRIEGVRITAVLLAGILSAALWMHNANAAITARAIGVKPGSKRDLSGLWVPMGSALDVRDGITYTGADDTSTVDSTAPFGSMPQLKGQYLDDFKKRQQVAKKASPGGFRVSCHVSGMPTMMTSPYAVEIIQTPRQINWAQEYLQETRRLYLDGRSHPSPGEAVPTFEGHSTGTWDGDVLVVETVNIRPETVLGDPDLSDQLMGHSAKLRIVERMYLQGKDILKVDGTVEDPEALVKPWQYSLTFRRSPREDEYIEFICEDNNSETLDPVTGHEVTRMPETKK